MRVTKEIYVPKKDLGNCYFIKQYYTDPTGLRRAEYRDTWGESDFSRDTVFAFSEDNGKTFGAWENARNESFRVLGQDELSCFYQTPVFNHQNGHSIRLMLHRIFIDGHEKAYERYWQNAEKSFFDHTYLMIEDFYGNKTSQLVKYEDGAEFDEANPRDDAFLTKNYAYYGVGMFVENNGDIVFPLAASLENCAKILGVNTADFFPSCPQIMHGLMIVRGHWNGERYALSFSKPIIISDLKSSRAVDEPIVTKLPSGRILTVFRGANTIAPKWNTRIEKGTPGHKWYCYSDDGGKTFTDPMPWHYEDGEVFYSSATLSKFFRCERTGQIYWLGNITSPKVEGSFPRYPIVIAKVGETGLLIHDSVTVIDTRQEGESEQVQLSNFELLQDRETGHLEVSLTKIGTDLKNIWYADSMRYIVKLE